MDLADKQSLFAQNVAKLIQYIYVSGYHCSLGEVYRTPEQAALNAKKGTGIENSLHCKRLAIDLNLFSKDGKYLTDTEEYEKIGIYWEALDQLNRWGGRFHSRPDGNHFEMMDK